jgi:hypothetical protein
MKRFLLALISTAALAGMAGTALAQDVCAPAKVTTLAAQQFYANIKLTWTATGNDCSTGDASTYEVRISTSPITDTNWQSTSILCSGTSATNGNVDCCLKDVIPCATTTFYFAVFLFDGAGNRSPISNVVAQSARCSGTHIIGDCP